MFLELLKTTEDFSGFIVLFVVLMFLVISNDGLEPIKCRPSEIGGCEENFIFFMYQLLPVDVHVQFQLR